MGRPWIEHWTPDDEEFWETTGKAIARRNLIPSILTEFLGFSVWVLWSMVAASLPDAGFSFSPTQLFTLVAVPTLVGAAARFPYSFAVSRLGGRNWTVISALLLLVPVALLVIVVSDPDTPYPAVLLAAATAGVGGGNFASSMTNISFFYPESRKGLALGLNAAGGNVGVAAAQVVVPSVIGIDLPFVGSGGGSGGLHLQNAALIWVPLIVAAALCAWLFMDNLEVSRAGFEDHRVVLRRKQTWIMSWLYVGTFGSFIGYTVALPLLIETEFPGVGLSTAFVAALIGSLSRPVGGWLADRAGGARVTFAAFTGMALAALAIIFFLTSSEPYSFAGFLTSSIVLVLLTGIGNGSTYRMIPMIFRAIHGVDADGHDAGVAEGRAGPARREGAAALGFIGAVGAFGGWLVPQGYALSSSITGGPVAAMWASVVLLASCIGLTWWCYLRRRFAVSLAPSLAEARV